MSFNDLTAKAAAANKPTPAQTANPPAKDTETKAEEKDAPAASKTS